MALYKDGNPVSGLNSVPELTLAQYNALNVKPKFWVRTDAPESYKKLSADQVSYDSNNTVEDMIDDIDSRLFVQVVTGTLTAETGDYIIQNILPENSKVISGYFLTTYEQYRPMSIGQYSKNLVIMGATSNMANRPFRVFVLV